MLSALGQAGNIHLSATVLIAAAQGWWQQATKTTSLARHDVTDAKPYLHGFDAWTWTVVLLQAGGGLLVAAIIKYADNVLKGLATGVSVVVSSALSMVLFHTPLGPKFMIGACLILHAVWFFSNPLPDQVLRMMARTAPSFKDDSLREDLLPK